MTSILSDLAELFPDTVVVQPGTLNEVGTFIASGSTSSYDCHISGRTRLIRDPTGKEVVSSVKITVAATPGLTTHLHRYTLPVRFNPRTNLRAVAVQLASDEGGAHHEVVYLP